MTIRDIFVPLFADLEFNGQLDAANQLAHRLDAHINAVFIHPDPKIAAVGMPEMMASSAVTLELIERERRIAEEEALVRFDHWRASHDIPLDPVGRSMEIKCIGWRTETGSVEPTIAAVGRLSDLIILNRPTTNETVAERALDAALFKTGRPTLLVPKQLLVNLTDHVVIAWNSSLEAARAVAGAMPILQAAERVSILTIPHDPDDPVRPLDLAEHLAWHGIGAEYLSSGSDTDSVGTALLNAATDQSATMLVMGAYTHSRTRQMVLGGVTRHVIQNAAIPVLMTH